MQPAAPHSARVEVDLSALVGNARVLRRALPAGARLGILVKANAYGHGLEMAARAAVAGGADQLIVATLDEGLAVRRAGLTAPVLVVYPIEPDGMADAVAAGLELSVSGRDPLRRTLEAFRRVRHRQPDSTLRLHVEVDSGMGRGGIAPSRLVEAVAAAGATPGVELAGAWSHLADGRDAARSAAQSAAFDTALAAVAASGRPRPARHLVASEGLFAASAPVHELARVGLAFYGELGLGFEPHPDLAPLAAELRPALSLVARPMRIEPIESGDAVGYGGEWVAERASRIGTLAIGYADGWSRASWPATTALVRGRHVPLVGRVSMDAVCVDLTDVPEATIDDEVVLLGGQGDDRITANEVAAVRGTIPNEVLATLGPRLPRRYLRTDLLDA